MSALAARYYFNNTGVKPRTTNNYYGATIGGPILKNRMFFFGDFLRYSNHSTQYNLISVPTAAFRSGDLSAGPTNIYDPSTGNPDGTGRAQFSYNGVANVIPPNRISPVSQAILALVPMPNIPGAGFTNNYQANTGFSNDVNTFERVIALEFRPVIYQVNVGLRPGPWKAGAVTHQWRREAGNINADQATGECIEIYTRNADLSRILGAIIGFLRDVPVVIDTATELGQERG